MYSQPSMQVAYIVSEQQFKLHVCSAIIKVAIFNMGCFLITDAPSKHRLHPAISHNWPALTDCGGPSLDPPLQGQDRGSHCKPGGNCKPHTASIRIR